MDLAKTDLNDVVSEFALHRLGQTVDGDEYEAADEAFFRDLVTGVVEHQRALDPMLDKRLADGWRLGRIDSILRAILRAAAFELAERPDIPARAVINEYVDVAHAFFEGDEPKVVNGILDRLAHDVRAAEFEQPANG
jgi:N utilization substance protein B